LGAHSQPTTVARDAGAGAPAVLPAVTSLTRRMLAGEEAAYRTFHETYYPRLARYLLVVAHGDEDAAREALQATFVRAVRHIKVCDEEARFWNWLTVLARTAFADQRRKRSRYRAFLDRFTEHARIAAPLADADPNEARLLAALESSLRTLPPADRELVEQKYFERESVRDIATALAASEKAVESRLSRVRRKLKATLLELLKHETGS